LLAVDETLTEVVKAFALAVIDFELISGSTFA